MQFFWKGFEKQSTARSAKYMLTEPGVAPLTHAGLGALGGEALARAKRSKGVRGALIGGGIGALSGLITGQVKKTLRRKSK